ncbi:hypothetical protein NQ314_012639 [Rhamnusium bicolor]|uniref:Uncharacterized protein n=1 Tax=Rhamnusium bicolor TaxID=1586634 RepID=A0AAV8XA19_9CUCU|nr:hypothetical protein NQ314_012639 [Rhamnusium bicolor]
MEFTDEYTHDIPGVIYFSRNMPTKEVEHLYQHDLQGCNCKSECKNNACSCLQRSGTFYKYNNIFELNSYRIEDFVKGPTYECNENCKCNSRLCGNKLVQFGPRKSLMVKPCENEMKGLGLFTLKTINRGSFICEYAGEVITETEAFKRFQYNNEHGKINYIFCINEYFGETSVQTFIDPTYYGNIGRYINHSCEPNCKLFVIRINDTMPILGIFADQDINKNSEITYDYGDGQLDFKNLGGCIRKSCHCNSKKCRKYLPFNVSLS